MSFKTSVCLLLFCLDDLSIDISVTLNSPTIIFIFLKINYFIYFWLRWVFVAAHGLSLVAASGGHSLLWCAGFSLRWLLLLQSTGSRHASFSSFSTRAQ